MKPQFKLIRRPQEDITIGDLFYRDRFLCDTIEDVVRDRNADGDLLDQDEGKVYGETAIPYGIYELVVTYSPTFKKNMTLVKNVKHFDGIRIHWGRTIENSLGCVLVGKRNGKELENIGMTDKITTMVNELTDRGERVYLEII
jgi:hypothetical protein